MSPTNEAGYGGPVEEQKLFDIEAQDSDEQAKLDELAARVKSYNEPDEYPEILDEAPGDSQPWLEEVADGVAVKITAAADAGESDNSVATPEEELAKAEEEIDPGPWCADTNCVKAHNFVEDPEHEYDEPTGPLFYEDPEVKEMIEDVVDHAVHGPRHLNVSIIIPRIEQQGDGSSIVRPLRAAYEHGKQLIIDQGFIIRHVESMHEMPMREFDDDTSWRLTVHVEEVD